MYLVLNSSFPQNVSSLHSGLPSSTISRYCCQLDEFLLVTFGVFFSDLLKEVQFQLVQLVQLVQPASNRD